MKSYYTMRHGRIQPGCYKMAPSQHITHKKISLERPNGGNVKHTMSDLNCSDNCLHCIPILLPILAHTVYYIH